MKKITILFILLMLVSFVNAQDAPNFNEWFRQKKTQIKYLVQQIAALQVYLGYLKKGYEIADKGLSTVGNIKDGTFSQDQSYLNSLKNVNPVVTNSPQVSAILMYQQDIIREFRNLQEAVQRSGYFTEEEKEYVRTVHANMLEECSNAVDELTLVITARQAEMKDDERLLRLDKVHEEMLGKYEFTRTFVSSTKLLAVQRAKAAQEISETGKFFEEM